MASETVELSLQVGEMHLEYAGCGSHEIAVTIKLSEFDWRGGLRAHLLREIERIDAALGPDLSGLRQYYNELDAAEWGVDGVADDFKRRVKREALDELEAKAADSPEHAALWKRYTDFVHGRGQKPVRP